MESIKYPIPFTTSNYGCGAQPLLAELARCGQLELVGDQQMRDVSPKAKPKAASSVVDPRRVVATAPHKGNDTSVVMSEAAIVAMNAPKVKPKTKTIASFRRIGGKIVEL